MVNGGEHDNGLGLELIQWPVSSDKICCLQVVTPLIEVQTYIKPRNQAPVAAEALGRVVFSKPEHILSPHNFTDDDERKKLGPPFALQGELPAEDVDGDRLRFAVNLQLSWRLFVLQKVIGLHPGLPCMLQVYNSYAAKEWNCHPNIWEKVLLHFRRWFHGDRYIHFPGLEACLSPNCVLPAVEPTFPCPADFSFL